MPQKNKERVTLQTKEDSKKYNWDSIDFPMVVKDLETFEKDNKNIALIVFVATGKKEIAPLYQSKRLNITPKERIITLFVYEGHYCVVTNKDALLLKEGQKNGTLACIRCMATFSSDGRFTAKERLENHLELCQNFDYAKTKFPKEGNHTLKFKNYKATLKHPIMITFDFESLLEKCNPGDMENAKQISKHTPVSFGLYVNRFDENNEYFDHIGMDSVRIFVDKLEAIVKDFYKEFLKNPKSMMDVEIANEALNRETKCWFCKEDLYEDKVRDHDHFTGKFRGIAHNKCNLKAKKSFFIPILAHNLNYDEGLFFRVLVDKFGFTKIIPKNTENFISLSKFFRVDTKMKGDKKKGIYVELRFLDSFRFMGLSLEKLVNSARKEDLKSLKKEFGDNFDLVCKKGIIPYSYLTCMDRLRERNFPSLEEFLKNDLKYKNPKREDYKLEETFLRAKRVWDEYVEEIKEKYENIYKKDLDCI